MTFRVQFTQEATEDLERLFDSIVERESARDGDLDVAQQALDAIRQGIETLQWTPFSCRKVGASSFLRELVIPFGHAGYIALFEIMDERTVVVAASRHQHEDDYH